MPAQLRVAGEAIASVAPDWTIHLGDISLDGDRDPRDLAVARELVVHWPTRLLCLPGNHDMGTASGEELLRPDCLARYLNLFGNDHWIVHAQGWALCGVNAQLLGSGGSAEAAQWDWIEHEATTLPAGTRVAVFLHRPLCRAPNDNGMPAGRYVSAAAAHRLRETWRDALEIVISGHTHQALDFCAYGVRHVWTPSSSFFIDDSLQAAVGRKQVGLGLLSLDNGPPRYETWSPCGLQQHELTRFPWFAEFAAAH